MLKVFIHFVMKNHTGEINELYVEENDGNTLSDVIDMTEQNKEEHSKKIHRCYPHFSYVGREKPG